ncbi:MAG: 1,4-alpha-glucan branching enzyme GlgB [Chlamydiales bacterium]|nr:1,4-alpha-glucan branching enzyme GlgB [Chlamydiales bacterium]MCH9620285.1 1,4-alpha-glucan branching enzyme GlgB [Chlamydiales bacterium]MCH9622804.1 1,4-alpha-glucan branching enzyme GlgB [Chlamydiales bacterium]
MWYKEAIIYELHVKCFNDSQADGLGDFKGLTQKLDYLQDLGVTAIWLLPFYPSPLRDDGYDIADYLEINPQFGSLQDFKIMLKEAHKRKLKVITELVINHTSDQHPWFKRARRAPAGSKYRDYYVWNDAPDRFSEARIIFQDFESSNWTWDPVANAYYWHRFYSHQPDLNFENPEVHEEIFKVLDFWLKMGVDGVRLDAIPYLYEEEGTVCENLPKTHAFLKKLRSYVDDNYDDRMLLGEANQWPEDAAKYFGEGDECHMAFHFPVMPRLFMAIHLEDALPIIEIMKQTPKIPDSAQWALFLRNHDELTLEMVTDEERDYMFRVYAHDPQARVNLGIRRRLAPLLKNDRRKIELMNTLLFSLVGTPVLYYGDEIGMGDNIYLGDRNGVRTPMQWSSDRNAGFSKSNPQRLYLPPITDPEYHYETVNVEAQSSNPYSMLWWTKQLIALRKKFKAFSYGETHFLVPQNRKVLVFFREYEDELIMIVANLSRFVQYVELDLSRYNGYHLVELFSGEDFPPIGELPYFLTLGSYGYYWFALQKEPQMSLLTKEELAREREIQEITIEADPESLFSPTMEKTLQDLLIRYLTKRAWFRSASPHVDMTRVKIVDHFKASFHGIILSVNFTTGEKKEYPLFLNLISKDKAENWLEGRRHEIVAQIHLHSAPEETFLLCDVGYTKTTAFSLIELIKSNQTIEGNKGELKGISFADDRETKPLFEEQEKLIVCREKEAVSVPLEEGVLKIFTSVNDSMAFDVKIRLFLMEKTNFTSFLPLLGYLQYRAKGRAPIALAEEVGSYKKQYTAQEMAIEAAERFLVQIETNVEAIPKDILFPKATWLEMALGEIPEQVPEMMEEFLELARHLGKTTGEFHLALSQGGEDPDFTPEEYTRFYQRSFYQTIRQKVLEALTASTSQQLLELNPMIQTELNFLVEQKIEAKRICCHGNYVLENFFHVGKTFLITNFGGEYHFKRSPLLDCAHMLFSFMESGGLAIKRLQARGQLGQTPIEEVYRWIHSWATWIGSSFLRSYFKTIEKGEGDFLPKDPKQMDFLLHLLLVEKCMEKLAFEKNEAALTMLLHWLPKYDGK